MSIGIRPTPQINANAQSTVSVARDIARRHGLPEHLVRQVVNIYASPAYLGRSLSHIAEDHGGVAYWTRYIQSHGMGATRLTIRFTDESIRRNPLNAAVAKREIAGQLGLEQNKVNAVFDMYTSILKRDVKSTARDFNGIKYHVDSMNWLMRNGRTFAQAAGEIRMNIMYSDEALSKNGVRSFEQVGDDIALNFGALSARLGGFRPELQELAREAGRINSTSSTVVARNHWTLRGAIFTYIGELDAGRSPQHAMNAAKAHLRANRF